MRCPGAHAQAPLHLPLTGVKDCPRPPGLHVRVGQWLKVQCIQMCAMYTYVVVHMRSYVHIIRHMLQAAPALSDTPLILFIMKRYSQSSIEDLCMSFGAMKD